MSESQTNEPGGTRRLLAAVVLSLVAGSWAGWHAWSIQQQRTVPLDVDNWGHLVQRMETDGRSLSTLFSEPSLWKGPVVPFVFGLAYYVFPVAESVLVLNVLLIAFSAACFYLSFTGLGARPLAAATAILLWIVYPPHTVVFGYYLAEPCITAIAAAALLLAAQAIRRKSVGTCLPLGAVCGVLMLARAPFVLVVAGVFLVVVGRLQGNRVRAGALFVLGCALTFLPWSVRNWVQFHEFIPFTTEGGKILYQGVWLPGDDAIMGFDPGLGNRQIEGSIRESPEFRQLEERETGMSPTEHYRYWQKLAIEEFKKDPGGELVLCVRKSMRFWVRLPSHSWIPQWKTAAVAIVALPLALLGFWKGRRRPLEQLCAAYVGGLWLFHSLVHSELRYNFPVLPFAFMLAVLGAQHVCTWVFGHNAEPPVAS